MSLVTAARAVLGLLVITPFKRAMRFATRVGVMRIGVSAGDGDSRMRVGKATVVVRPVTASVTPFRGGARGCLVCHTSTILLFAGSTLAVAGITRVVITETGTVMTDMSGAGVLPPGAMTLTHTSRPQVLVLAITVGGLELVFGLIGLVLLLELVLGLLNFGLLAIAVIGLDLVIGLLGLALLL